MRFVAYTARIRFLFLCHGRGTCEAEARDDDNMTKFEFIDHSGDLGILVFGRSRPELFQHAAEAFFQILTEPKKVRKKLTKKISLQVNGDEELLVSWLNEFIYLFDTQGLLFSHFQILALDDRSMEAVARGEPYEEGRHPIKRTIKGTTYHQLRIHEEGGIWKAQVIFDL